VSTVDEIRSKTSTLTAGDTMIVEAGTYDMSTWSIAGIVGTPGKWIVIEAEGDVAIRSNSGCCNLVQMENVHYIRFAGFELTMASAHDGIDGINIRGVYNSNLVFEDLHIHHMSNVGIGMWPDSTAHVTLRNSEIAHNTGSGIYWGYPDRNIVHDVLIEKNYIHHCPSDPAHETHYGIQWKGGCYRAVIQDNVLHDVGGASRCGIVVYYGKSVGRGDDPADINIIRRNVMWNCRNEGITAMADALVENNIVFDARYGIHLQTYSGSYTENLTIRNNTVFRCASSCISISGWSGAGSDVSLVGNVAYQDNAAAGAISGSSTGSAVIAGNYYYGTSSLSGEGKAVRGTGLGDFVGVAANGFVPDLNFYPSSDAPFVDAVDEYPAEDFDGTPRPSGSTGDAGAYERTVDGYPGWYIAEEFKGASSAPVSFTSRAAGGRPGTTSEAAVLELLPISGPSAARGRSYSLRGRRVNSRSTSALGLRVRRTGISTGSDAIAEDRPTGGTGRP
jgi:hypothetical protein